MDRANQQWQWRIVVKSINIAKISQSINNKYGVVWDAQEYSKYGTSKAFPFRLIPIFAN
jgi:hypothetical protein